MSPVKIAWLILTLSVLSIPSFSQVNWGIKGGPNLANLHRRDGGNREWMPSVHLGLWMEYPVTERMSLKADLLLTDKGCTNNGNKFHLTYISLPVMGSLHFGKFSLDAGFGFSVLTDAYVMSDEDRYEVEYGEVNCTDWQLSGGISYYPIHRLGLSLRYEHGLSNTLGEDARYGPVIKDSDPALGSMPEVKDSNQNFQLSVSFQINRG